MTITRTWTHFSQSTVISSQILLCLDSSFLNAFVQVAYAFAQIHFVQIVIVHACTYFALVVIIHA